MKLVRVGVPPHYWFDALLLTFRISIPLVSMVRKQVPCYTRDHGLDSQWAQQDLFERKDTENYVEFWKTEEPPAESEGCIIHEDRVIYQYEVLSSDMIVHDAIRQRFFQDLEAAHLEERMMERDNLRKKCRRLA